MAPSKNTLTVGVFSVTLFLSAFLMFALQPMTGKMLLPLVGGTPAGWVVAMAFFQSMLLAGYFLAHTLAKFSPRKHALLFIVVLGLGLFFLPPGLSYGSDVMTSSPTPLDVFKLLFLNVALPFLAISATSSTVQRLFTTTTHAFADDPYFLYAASNLGSLGGLLLYPLVAEPFFGLKHQSQTWLMGYVLLIGLAVVCLLMTRNNVIAAQPEKAAITPAPTTQQKLNWILLAFIPSSLMLGVTMHITTNIFSAPMMWVVPLAIYLLTFIIAFSRRPVISLPVAALFQPFIVMLVVAFMFMLLSTQFSVSWSAVSFHFIAFGITALMCHLRLAQSRPQDTRHLTSFYLMMSIGGALGGILNAFIIPNIFDSLIEYPVMLVLSLLVNPNIREKIKPMSMYLYIAAVVAAIIGLSLTSHIPAPEFKKLSYAISGATILAIFGATTLSANTRTCLILCATAILSAQLLMPQNVLFQERNFYGVVRVTQNPIKLNNKMYEERLLRHGSTGHGSQIMGPEYETTKTSYYNEGNPASDVINIYNPKNIAIVGLGAGTMNCYSNPDNAFTFIDIDKAVVDVAQKYFTYLSACKASRPPKILIGDGRLELAKMTDEKFDLILLDAFASDAIPVHLLTTDAIRVYQSRLTDKGIILFHISNRYFNLVPVLTKNAIETGMVPLAKLYIPPHKQVYASISLWVAMTKSDFNPIALQDFNWTKYTEAPEGVKAWTDDDNNLLSALIVVNEGKNTYIKPQKHSYQR